jgi:large subunit ribosomal protein L13|tara:strand:- start:2722 stop:3300 length:579 start_codon:yes stop_codon:yes gene_type:complete
VGALGSYFASRPLFWGLMRVIRDRLELKYLLERGCSSTIRASNFRKNTHRMKTFNANAQTVRREWYVVDATDKVLGRLASEVATRLRGKHKPEYTPHVDTGDHIVIVNAEKVRVTGNKAQAKIYHWHTGYPGGIKEISFAEQIERHPTRVIESAVKGMLPKNTLGRAMFSKLRVYAGPEHEHQAQQPKTLEL